MDDLIKIGITAMAGALVSYLTYKLGRRAKIDDVLFEKRLKLIEQIGEKMHSIETGYQRLEKYWDTNTSDEESREDAITRFAGDKSLYMEQHQLLIVSGSRAEVKELLSKAIVLSKPSILGPVEDWLRNDPTHHEVIAGRDSKVFYREFFQYIADMDAREERRKLYEKAKSALAKCLRS